MTSDKKILLFLFLGIFLISSLHLISALDSELPQACGGDDQLIIACLPSDSQLIFLGGILSISPSGGSGVATNVTEEEEIIPKIEKAFKEIGWYIILGILLLFLFFIWWRKKKCNECRKKFKRKEMKKYNGKWYCKACYSKLSK